MNCINIIRMALKRPGLLVRVIREEKALMHRFYTGVSASFVDNAAAKAVIFTVNGMVDSLGLADRLKGAVTIYQWCRLNNRDFRIFWSQPFDLRQFLIPADYNWSVNEDELSYAPELARPMMFIGVSEPLFLERLHTDRQLHCFANRQLTVADSFSWSASFAELFKPSPRLEKLMAGVKCSLNDKYRSFVSSDSAVKGNDCRYTALVFRFQNLLCDFAEADYAPLSESDRISLISQCHKAVEHVRRISPGSFFLVCSDSGTFLDSIAGNDDLFVIPGRVVHMAYSENESFEVYAKSFIDLFMIAGAEKVYNIVCGNMYPSGFPETAAQIGNIPFERLYL